MSRRIGGTVERWKGIAAYVSAATGISVSETVARKWSARPVDPLPVERFVGRVFADTAALDVWIERQRGGRRGSPPRPRRRPPGS